MLSKIIDFVNLLRENEVPIGLTETIDAINCLKLIICRPTFQQGHTKELWSISMVHIQ